MLNIKKNIPNILTIFRILLVIPILAVYSSNINETVYYISNIAISLKMVIIGTLFVVSSLTDFLDGYIARKYQLVSNFGKIWDPLSDKILVNTVLILLAISQLINPIICILFITRDVVVDGYRMYNAQNNIIIPANIFGKLKTVSQMIGITIVLFIGGVNTVAATWYYWVVQHGFLYLALGFSFVSMLIYTNVISLPKKIKKRKHLKN